MDARDWDRRYAEAELVWSAGPNQFVAAEVADLPPGEAVDVAAGEGRNSLWLASRGWRVTAVDFSRVALEKGRRLQARLEDETGTRLDVEWVCADVLDHDLGTGGYDLAVLAYLQLPADQRREVVRRSFLSLRAGGTLLVVAHDSTNLTEGTGGPQDPSVLYTAEELLGDLDGERFEVVRAGRVAREVAAPGGEGESAHRAAEEVASAGAPRADGSRVAYDALLRVVRLSAAGPRTRGSARNASIPASTAE